MVRGALAEARQGSLTLPQQHPDMVTGALTEAWQASLTLPQLFMAS